MAKSERAVMTGHVLLVLSKEEEARVLAEDACGGRPPSAHRVRGNTETEWRPGRSAVEENALVLAWNWIWKKSNATASPSWRKKWLLISACTAMETPGQSPT